jgi:MFS family permease
MSITEPALTARQSVPKRVHEAKDNITNGIQTTTMKTERASSLNKIRLLYFFYRFSTGSLIPFMSLFMSSCGFTHEEIGRLQAIRPIVTMISAPFWGGLADRTGRKKLILIVSLL